MRLDSLTVKGWSSAFPGVVRLPFDELRDAEIIALVGSNGSGKTSLLDAIAAAIYRKLPARGGLSAVDHAIGRDSFVDLKYSFGGVGDYRARVSFDNQTRKTEAVLEELRADGLTIPLNNGQASTFDQAIATRFPSFDLFINSSFAAQGRGDEFARATPSKRKDLFVEFLNLKHLLTMAGLAGEAAEHCDDAVLRLTVAVEALEKDTAAGVREALVLWEAELAEKHQRTISAQAELGDRLTVLEARATLTTDFSASVAAAQLQVTTFTQELRNRRAELETAQRQAVAAARAADEERAGINVRHGAALKDVDGRIAGNQQIQEKADSIRAAVDSIAALDNDIRIARTLKDSLQADRNVAARNLATAEQRLSSFTKPQSDLERAKTDAKLLVTVPCGGAGEFAACEFLTNAKRAEARIEQLSQIVDGMTTAITDRDAHARDLQALDVRLADVAGHLTRLEADKAAHAALAKYADALTESDARLGELKSKRADLEIEHGRQLRELDDRERARKVEWPEREHAICLAMDRLMEQLQTAQDDLDAATAGQSQTAGIRRELATAKAEWDGLTTALGEIASSRQELERRRQDIARKREALADRLVRLGQAQDERLAWESLQKALGKGGLLDLELDAAGPGISALANQLLLKTFGPRFTLELVTQVEKADGSGMKDSFTVRVLDTEEQGGGWRDLSQPSGGEKVVIQEALMCAICIYINERSPLPIRTLFRDETGAALDAQNAVRYVQMLRAVKTIGGFEQVFFISHVPAAFDLADAQIRVGGGQVSIAFPPFEATEAA
jgi:exonuclease SbcC